MYITTWTAAVGYATYTYMYEAVKTHMYKHVELMIPFVSTLLTVTS